MTRTAYCRGMQQRVTLLGSMGTLVSDTSMSLILTLSWLLVGVSVVLMIFPESGLSKLNSSICLLCYLRFDGETPGSNVSCCSLGPVLLRIARFGLLSNCKMFSTLSLLLSNAGDCRPSLWIGANATVNNGRRSAAERRDDEADDGAESLGRNRRRGGGGRGGSKREGPPVAMARSCSHWCAVVCFHWRVEVNKISNVKIFFDLILTILVLPQR